MSDINKKPAIRFQKFTDAWEQRKFSDITFPSGEKNRDNLPYESYSITNESGFVPQDEKFENGGTMRDADKRMYYIVSPQSFAYNPARINVGSIGYQNTPKNVIVSSLYEVFKTTDDVDDRFLWHWFKSDDFQKLIVQLQEGGVRLYFYYDKLCMGSIALPSLAEQRQIGTYLDKLDNLITLHQRKYDKLKNIKKSMLEKMFPKNGSDVPEIRFKGFTDAWEQRKLDTITDVRDGTHDSPQYVETGHPFITSKNVKDGFINYEDIQYVSDKDYEEINKRSKVDKNDILMGMIGTIGNIALVRETPDFAIKNVALIKDIGDVYYRYLYHCLQSNSVAHQLDENLDGGTQKFIALNKIRELVIPVPSEHEQHKIGDYMESLDNLITLHQRKLEKLKNIKKSMLEKMFV